MKRLTFILLVIALFSFPEATFSQQAKRLAQFNIARSGLAIEGYDPVAYFSQGKAVEGKKDISYDNNGITYRFSTMNNRQEFMANPGRYEPQYGGWCAYAMGATGEKVEVDPGTFKIVNSKLYLFYNSFFNNTLKTWNKNEASLMSRADVNWKKYY